MHNLNLIPIKCQVLKAQFSIKWNVDPKSSEGESPYVAFMNNPIIFTDPLGDTTKLFAIGSKDAEYCQIEGGMYDDGSKKVTRLGVDQTAYDNYKNSDAGKKALQKSEKDFVQGLVKYLDLQSSNSGSKYITRETNVWSSTFTGNATLATKNIDGHKNATITQVLGEKNGKFTIFSSFDDDGKAEVLSCNAVCGESDYGAIPNSRWFITNTGRLRNYEEESQFFTTENGTLPSGDDYLKSKFGFTFNIEPTFKTGRTEIRLHPHGFSTGCIALLCNPTAAKAIYNTINGFLLSQGKSATINLDVDIKNNEKAVSKKP